ncbi:MAG: hypothetical protein AAGG68_06060 [Bacteroidota bacterium]
MNKKEQRATTKEIITLLELNIDHYGFKRILFSRKKDWLCLIDREEIEYLINVISKNSYALYIVLPFFWVFLGIDLYEYYRNHILKEDDVVRQIIDEFHLYPNDLSNRMWKKYMLEDFGIDEAILLEIREKLKKEGFLTVPYLTVYNSDEKLYF